MPVHWREQMSIDGGAIDTDHKFLILLINEFEQQLEAGFDQGLLLDALKRLEYYTVYHFSREEAIQQRIGFANCKDHAERHRQLRINVKSAIGLFSKTIPKQQQQAVKERILKLLKFWIINHIAKHDKAMAPYFKNFYHPQSIRPMIKTDGSPGHGYSVLLNQMGSMLGVRVVITNEFAGISFKGTSSPTDSAILAKGCEIINSSLSAVIVACFEEMEEFDEQFIGHLLILLGTFIEDGRNVYMITGTEGLCASQLRRLEIDKIIKSFHTSEEFYQEVGFKQ
ncbi:MAG: hemerythrin family protein [Rhodospirillaceae bacterium]